MPVADYHGIQRDFDGVMYHDAEEVVEFNCKLASTKD